MRAGELNSSHIGERVKVHTLSAKVQGTVSGIWHRKSYGETIPRSTQLEVTTESGEFTFRLDVEDNVEVISE